MDILRHLSRTPHPNVVQFEDAWEQDRKLYIQTELCWTTFGFFLQEYGKLIDVLDEGRIWKIIRDLADVSRPHCTTHQQH